MKPEQEEILKKAIEKFGIIHQVDMAQEECAELIQAINKMRRMGGFGEPMKIDDQDYCLTYWGLCSEIADVKIMIAQLEMIFSKEAIQMSVDRKIDRLQQRLNKDGK